MEIAQLYEIFQRYPNITTDSRICIKDSIFFALKGETFNGNDFALKAIDKGCSYAVVDEIIDVENPRLIKVNNVLETLQQLANYHRRKLKIPILGITGTNGKTTTKELVSYILSKEFKVAYTQGNFNNHIGVPLTLLSMNKTHEMAVVEMGANHPGEIKELCKIAEPNFGLITNVGKAHIEGFGSFENVIKTKGELYDFIRENNGKVFVNKDNPYLYNLSEDMDRILYGKDDSELFASATLRNGNPYLEFEWRFFDNVYHVKTNLVGEYNIDNALAGIAVGKYFGINADYISNALNTYQPKNNRSQFERTENNDLIIDAYNANPTSMKVALDYFVKISSELPKTVILGEMKELGVLSDEEHKSIFEFVKTAQFDSVFLVGKEFMKYSMENKQNNIKFFDNVESLMKYLEINELQQHYILIKGSHSVHLEKLLPLL